MATYKVAEVSLPLFFRMYFYRNTPLQPLWTNSYLTLTLHYRP